MTTASAQASTTAATGRLRSFRSGKGSLAAQISKHVGLRFRLARIDAGISQSALGEVVGLSFQQIQKYETGKNRMSIGLLVVVAATVGKPVTWFLEGAPEVPRSLTSKAGA
jgi:DNA-binding XRE family transcriptional regulator